MKRGVAAFGLGLGIAGLACSTMPKTTAPLTSSPATPLLSQVEVNRKATQPASGQELAVGFHTSGTAVLALLIYDEDNLLVRTVRPPAALPPGEHRLEWDGKDESGALVPRGLYLYTLVASFPDGRSETYDPADATAGLRLKVDEADFDREHGVVRYTIPAPGRVRIRIGLQDGGPHLKTLVDWELRDAGVHEEAWDGRDESGEISLLENPAAVVGIRAYSLAENSVIVSDGPETQSGAARQSERLRETRPRESAPAGDYMHALHPRSICHEPQLRVELPEDLAKSADGAPILQGDVPLRVTLASGDEQHLISTRFEVAVFADMLYLDEEEEGYSPFTYVLQTSKLGPGPHLITINVLGNDDHFGVLTKRIVVQ